MLTFLCKLLGFPTDPNKDFDWAKTIVVLGSLCGVNFPGKTLSTQVELSKAQKYTQLLEAVLERQTLEPGQASKLAGRLSFAVTVSGNRVGRACIKPFHAQAHAPLPGKRTRIQTPEHVWCLLLDRGDNQIGFQELLGVLLARGTFSHLLRGALWLASVDNDGVLHALTKGREEDLNPVLVLGDCGLN